VNFQIPGAVAPGPHTLRLESAFGAVEQTIELAAVSPGIFTLGGNRGAIVNQNGTINGSSNPARRGEVISVYATGLGALRQQGALQVAVTPVTASIEGVPLVTQYAGAAPGFPGLFQINLLIPLGLPPGLVSKLTVGQSGALSQPVFVAIQ